MYSNVSIGKNASHRVFAQYLETEFRDLRLVLNIYLSCSVKKPKWGKYFLSHLAIISLVHVATYD